jgi:hypothetical protein
MAQRETFEPRLMALLTQSPHHHAAWLTSTAGAHALTPTKPRHNIVYVGGE